MLKAHIC